LSDYRYKITAASVALLWLQLRGNAIPVFKFTLGNKKTTTCFKRTLYMHC